MRFLTLVAAVMVAGTAPVAAQAGEPVDALGPKGAAEVEPMEAALEMPLPRHSGARATPRDPLPLSTIAGMPQRFRSSQDTQRFGQAHRLYSDTIALDAKAKVMLVRSAPMGGADFGRLQIVYDAARPETADDWRAFLGGELAVDHPGYPVRAVEAARGLVPGSCLSVQSGDVVCGAPAERLRAMVRGAERAKG